MAIANLESVVAAAAEALIAEGKRPSIKNVIAQIGGGSPNVVLKYLQEWKAQPTVRVPDPEIDAEIGKAITRYVKRVASEATKAAEDRAQDSEKLIEELGELNQEAERKIETLTAERDAALIEADNLRLKVAEAVAEAGRQIEQSKEIQQQLNMAMMDLGAANERLKDVPEQKREIDELVAKLADSERRCAAATETAARLDEREKARALRNTGGKKSSSPPVS